MLDTKTEQKWPLTFQSEQLISQGSFLFYCLDDLIDGFLCSIVFCGIRFFVKGEDGRCSFPEYPVSADRRQCPFAAAGPILLRCKSGKWRWPGRRQAPAWKESYQWCAVRQAVFQFPAYCGFAHTHGADDETEGFHDAASPNKMDGILAAQHNQYIKYARPMSTGIVFCSRKSVFCTRNNCTVYIILRIEIIKKLWYFIDTKRWYQCTGKTEGSKRITTFKIRWKQRRRTN